MEIRIEKPPVWEQANRVFDLTGRRPVFAWDTILYNPLEGHVDEYAMLHEEEHSKQQRAIGGPEIWWQKYLTDKHFRLVQELEAYKVQYRAAKVGIKDRNTLYRYALRMAGDCASSMYGCDITTSDALRLITTP